MEALLPLVARLHDALREMDPARFVAADREALHTKLTEIAGALRTAEGAPDEASALADAVTDALPEAEGGLPEETQPWVDARVAIGPAYEALVAALRDEGIDAPSIRPTNYARTVFHMCSGLFALFVIEVLNDYMIHIAGAFFASAFIMESARAVSPKANEVLMAGFGKVAHPYERHRINSASWYAAALILIACLAPNASCAAAVVVLGFADPAAATVGRRFGKTKLVHGRSLEGTAAFAVVGFVVSLVVLRGFHASEMNMTSALLVAAVAGVAGAIAELFSKRVDDNFSIPVCVAFATMFLPAL